MRKMVLATLTAATMATSFLSLPVMGCDRDYNYEDIHTYEDDYNNCNDWDDEDDNDWDNEYDSCRDYSEDPMYDDCTPDVVDKDDNDGDYYKYHCEEIETRYMVALVRANVRSGPGTGYEVVDVVNAGEDVVVIGQAEDCSGKLWYKISDGNFVSAGALVSESEYGSYEKNEDEVECYEKEEEYYSEENCSEVEFYLTISVGANVRKGPGMCYEVVNGVSAGETVGIFFEESGWYYTDRGGYIAAQLFEPESSKSYCEDIDFSEGPKRAESKYYDNAIIINIESQSVKVYRNGELICSSSCVTGDDGSKDTPRGTFEIQSKEKDRNLVGEDYNVKVNFWMPFYDGCGLHDASWRDSFGGNIYQGSGSHGCVNLPYDVAETIYNNCDVGTQVVVE